MQTKVQRASGRSSPSPGRDENNPRRKGGRAAAGSTRGTRTGTRRSPRGGDGVSGLGAAPAAAAVPPALGLAALLPFFFLKSVWLQDGVWGRIVPPCRGTCTCMCPRTGTGAGWCGRRGSAAASRASVSPGSRGSDPQGLAVAPRSPVKAQPWITSAGSAGRLPCRPRTGADLGPGFLPAPSFLRAGPAGFPAADSARAPHDPHTRRGAAGRRPSCQSCPAATRFSPSHLLHGG